MIEALAKIICQNSSNRGNCDSCGFYPDRCCNKFEIAKRIRDAGYAALMPCKIGDFVWAIRNFKGKKHPQRGIVSDMYFTNDMRLIIVVKYVARGEWGKTVFASDKEAYAAIEGRKDNGN